MHHYKDKSAEGGSQNLMNPEIFSLLLHEDGRLALLSV
jgi:hypothetical protein